MMESTRKRSELIEKMVLFFLFLFFLFVFFIKFFNQKSLIENPNFFEIHTIRFHGNQITQQTDLKKIKELLKGYTKHRTLKGYSSYLEKDVFIEIGAIDNGRPLHILLGNFYICYESAEKGFWIIQGGEELLEKILYLVD